VEIGNNHHLAPRLARSPVRHPYDPPSIVDSQLSTGSLDLDEVGVNPRQHSSARVALAASPRRAQKRGREPTDQLALLKPRCADQQVRVDGSSSGGEQLSDDSVLSCDTREK
jgi:hypothetical protein